MRNPEYYVDYIFCIFDTKKEKKQLGNNLINFNKNLSVIISRKKTYSILTKYKPK